MNGNKSGISRRDLIFNMAPAAAAMAAAAGVAPRSPRIAAGAIRGRRIARMDAQNHDSEWPPSTDSKSLVPTFKYPFSSGEQAGL